MLCNNSHGTTSILNILSALLCVARADKRILTSPYDTESYNAGDFGQKPGQSFFSSPFRAPRLLVNEWHKSRCEPATHIFTAIDIGGQARSPVILSADDLSLVWADTSFKGGVGLRPHQYNGSTYLALFTGADHESWGSGSNILLDDTYREFARITPSGLENDSDPHEFDITEQGTAIVTNYHQLMGDCSSVGGPGGTDCAIWDSAFQEIDVATGEAIFTWRASDHVALDESYLKYKSKSSKKVQGWDFFHINSVQKTRDGKNYLVNGRHISGVMLVNGTTGERIWQLGGFANDFDDLSGGAATEFYGEHHARFSNEEETEISLFDNRGMSGDESITPGCEGEKCTRIVRVKLDYENMTAELVSAWHHPAGVRALAQGGHHALPGGGAMVSWGTVPALTEFSKDGEVCMDVQVGPWSTSTTGESNVYRAFKFNYTATPYWDPEIAVVTDKAYVSWNGATEVSEWVLYGGSLPSDMHKIAISSRQGFETMLDLPDPVPQYVRAEAWDKHGNVLRSTKVTSTSPLDGPLGKSLSGQVVVQWEQ